MQHKLTQILLLTWLCVPLICHSEKRCFTFAQTHYEQLYCEIKARGKGTQLPAFYEFQKNTITTQALLLKRPAREIGIDITLPGRSKNASSGYKKNAMPNKLAAKKYSTTTTPKLKTLSANEQNIENCKSEKNIIQCAQQHYHLVGNKPNQQLDDGVFASEQTMALPVFQGAIQDTQAVKQYLHRSYVHYLKKMLSIGLGASTLSYEKFSYLFKDLTDKKISFSERFETMYYYLKQDKKQLAINARLEEPESLILNQCYFFEMLLVCTLGMKNYIYLPGIE